MTPDDMAVPQPEEAVPPVTTPELSVSRRSWLARLGTSRQLGTVGVAAVVPLEPEPELETLGAWFPVANSSGRDEEGRHLEAEKGE